MAMEQSYPGFASQQEIDAAFAEWLEGFGHNSGGCDPIESGLEDLIAPDLCMGDTVYVTYTVTDDCGQEVSCTSSFGVERRQERVIYCPEDRKSTRLNSSHVAISYAGFRLKKKRGIE